VDEGEREELSRHLTADEHQRAARFHFAEHGHRFTVARARLRQQLAVLLSVQPGELRFSEGEHGKPALTDAFSAGGLTFNLSHSGAAGLVGWSWHRAIGVDIEYWRKTSDEAALVRRYFSPHEIAVYEATAPEARMQAFFNCWTRKEAYVKAVGRGLGLPLDSFDVSLDRNDARLLRASAVQDDGRRWSLASPQLEAGVSAAVVLEGADFLIQPA
jgi:4'-phosphopantetheinyl transferase